MITNRDKLRCIIRELGWRRHVYKKRQRRIYDREAGALGNRSDDGDRGGLSPEGAGRRIAARASGRATGGSMRHKIKPQNHAHGRQIGKWRPGQSGNPNGRPKGAKNRVTTELLEKLMSSGMSPVEFMTAVFRDDAQPMELRLEAASRVAPYFHPKMSVLVTVPPTIRDAHTLLGIERGHEA